MVEILYLLYIYLIVIICKNNNDIKIQYITSTEVFRENEWKEIINSGYMNCKEDSFYRFIYYQNILLKIMHKHIF